MSSLQHRRSSLTLSHPNCPLFPHDLAATCFERSGSSGQQEDLDQSTFRLSEKSSLPLAGPGPNTLQTHWDFTLGPLHRSIKSGDLEDVNTTIERLRTLSQHPPEVSKIPHHAITTTLIEMLAARAKGDARNALEDIDEIVVLCRKLLALDTPQDHLTSAFEALTQAALDDFSRGEYSQCLDRAVGCLRDALNFFPPGFHHLSLELAKLLVVRFLTIQIDGDYQEAKAVLHDIFRAPPNAYQIQASVLTVALGLARSIVYSNLEDWEGAVSRCCSFLEHCPSFGDPLHPVITELLTSRAEQASEHFSSLKGAQAARAEVASIPAVEPVQRRDWRI